MGSDIQRLETLAADEDLAKHVNVISIADDSESLDPYVTSELPSLERSYDIWPRNDAGTVVSSEIGVAALQALFRQQRLRPETIVIRDYRIAAVNFDLCSEMSVVRNLFVPKAFDRSDQSPVFALARDVIRSSDLAITSIQLKPGTDPSSQGSALSLPRFQNQASTLVLGSPGVSVVRIHLSPAHQGRSFGFSMLKSAELRLDDECAPYWIEQVFCRAVALDALHISIRCQLGTTIPAEKVLMKLRTFSLAHSRVPAEAIYSFLSASAHTLAELELRQVTLAFGFTWSEVLSTLATRLVAMTSFSLQLLREAAEGYMPLDWCDLMEEHLEE